MRQADYYWNSALCVCESRSVATRGLPDQRPCRPDLDGSLGSRLTDMILWLGLGSSLTLVLVLALVTRHYRARFVKLKYQKKRENLKGSSEDQFTADDPRDELDPRYSNSSASREFEQSFTYKDQLEHFLSTASSATRPSRKSRKSRK